MNRIAHNTSASSVIPMPGRLLVDYYDWDLRLPYSVPLNEVPTNTVVTTTGTITAVRRLSGGRAMVVITAGDGNSAHVLLNADVVRMTAPALFAGYRMTVRGMVFRAPGGAPAGIDAGGAQIEVA
jgi:hypothetical protein